MERYNPSAIEPKWQQIWEDQKANEVSADASKVKTYVAGMFPYPSGAGLHSGHAFSYTIVDAIARFYRQHGHNVLNPMGWDTFGLPAENYAIKTGTAPAVVTAENIANFKNQFKRIGVSIDWSREINTSDPEYYKWTQWVFTKLFERGLAYQKESLQWWCPVDKTVLANEQVEGGHCWRCGSLVEKKSMKQWFFKITEYADSLLDEIEDLDWPQKIKTAQTNWIGKSVGAEISFKFATEYQDSLKFTPELTQQILEGTKTSTIRLEAKQLKVGDAAEFLTRDGEQVAHFGGAKITQIRTTALKDIPNDLEGHEHYETDQQKLTDYQGYYGAGVTLDTEFTIYDFEFAADQITVFSTRPDTIFGASFIVLAPEHPLATKLATGDFVEATQEYVKAAIKKSEIERTNDTKEKTGVFTGSYVLNPLNGEKVPVWVADYVLGGYGTGAVMGVPGHDERDFAFAEKYNLPIIEVIEAPADNEEKVYHGEGTLINSGEFDGVLSSDARERIISWLADEKLGAAKTTYKMRDWLISRQRYWGAPIPIIHCDEHGAVPVPEDQLPVVLPVIDDYAPKGDGKSALARAEDWVHTTCPECGKPALRETDTMDGYACSSWYLLRYADPHNAEQAWDPEKINYWNPLEFYVGGDHAVAHLLYVRFWTHVFNDMGLVNFKEPVKRLIYHGYINAQDGRKMSKSLGNVIDPLEVIDQGYGADSLRTYVLFMGPIELDASWDPRGIAGVYRFLNRIWTLAQEFQASTEKNVTKNDDALRVIQHKTIRRVTDDFRRLSFNTAISALMEYVNDLYKLKVDGFSETTWHEALVVLVQMVAPFAPHLADELWSQLGGEGLVQNAAWPTWDESLTVEDTVTIAVQVNGKVRGEISVGKDETEEAVKAKALAHENVIKFVTTEPKKVIYVVGRLVSIVV
ncbi:MAG: class I tRNA ligase family protein [Candidatus Microsaccharimonas sp.]